MKGNDRIIEYLNEALTDELTAINVYFVNARMCHNWGFTKLWDTIRAESLDEMRHADAIIERILYLEGLPNLQRLGKVMIGESIPEQFRIALGMERNSIQKLNQGIELCREASDDGTRDLLTDLLEGSEEYANWLESQLNVIDTVGEANYLAQQV